MYSYLSNGVYSPTNPYATATPATVPNYQAYQPNPYYQQQMAMGQPPVQQQAQPQQVVPQRVLPFNQVHCATADEAKAQLVPPNQSVMFWDAPNGMFRIKATDATGMSKISHYKFVETDESGKPLTDTSTAETPLATPTEPPKQYVTAEEYAKGIAELQEKLEKYRNEV